MARKISLLILISLIPLAFVSHLAAISQTAVAGDQPIYGTYLGGDLPDYGRQIAVDPNGNVYLAGRSESTNFPTQTVQLPTSGQHGIDAFVTKFNADGTQADYIFWFYTLVFFALDEADDIVVDAEGHAYVVGNTASDDFCSLFGTVPGYNSTYNNGGDAFLLKIKPDGSGLVYCTFLGGSDLDRATAVAIDDEGNAYVTGGTFSTDFITHTNTINSQHGGVRDMFLLKIDPTGTAVLHASLLGGTGQDEARSIALDADNNVYLTGWTNSPNFTTTTGVVGPTYGGNFDAFLVKLNTVTPTLEYATYIGGSQEDRAYGLAVDNDGYAYIGGLTRSDDFPVTANAYTPQPQGGSDGFIAKLNHTASQFTFSTFVGGSLDDQIMDITLNNGRHVFATGDSWSADFPVTPDAHTPALIGERSAFVSVLDNSGQLLRYSTYLGGNNWDLANSIAYANDRVYVAGATRSTDFPVHPNAFSTSPGGDYDAYFTSFPLTVTEAVVANFTAVPSSGPAPLTVHFQNLSTGDDLSYSWQFGDGQTSSLFEPTHVYTAVGSYTATLTVTGLNGSDTVVQPTAVVVQPLFPIYLPLILKP